MIDDIQDPTLCPVCGTPGVPTMIEVSHSGGWTGYIAGEIRCPNEVNHYRPTKSTVFEIPPDARGVIRLYQDDGTYVDYPAAVDRDGGRFVVSFAVD